MKTKVSYPAYSHLPKLVKLSIKGNKLPWLKSVQEGLKMNSNILGVPTLKWEKTFHTTENSRPVCYRFKTTANAASTHFKYVHNSSSPTLIPSLFAVLTV
jgi:hypothetical protein